MIYYYGAIDWKHIMKNIVQILSKIIKMCKMKIRGEFNFLLCLIKIIIFIVMNMIISML